MSRLSSMARFEGPDEGPDIDARCQGPYCCIDIYEGEEYILFEEKSFCCTSCMVDSLDYEWVGG